LTAAAAIIGALMWLFGLYGTFSVLVGVAVAYAVIEVQKGISAIRRLRSDVSEADLETAFKQLREISARVGEGKTASVETAMFLLETEKSSFERVFAGSDSIEAKATTLLGIATGAVGALGVFGIAKVGSPVTLTPFTIVAFGFVVVAFVALLYTLRAKRFDMPNMSVYLSVPTVAEDNRVPLALVVAARYGLMRENFSREISAEPGALAIAQASLAVAAMLVILSAVSQSPPSTQSPGAQASKAPSAQVSGPRGNSRSPLPGPTR